MKVSLLSNPCVGWRPLMAFALLILAVVSCGKKESSETILPNNGKGMTDEQKVAYLMKTTTPDSVANLICRAAIGEEKSFKIDTLANAMFYCYENYTDEDLQTFSNAVDTYTESLPLNLKMKLLKLEGQDDEMAIGYELGLAYVNVIRLEKRDAASIEKEIAALKTHCDKNPEDSAMYKRFLTGFKVALDMDGNADIPAQIYKKYSSH